MTGAETVSTYYDAYWSEGGSGYHPGLSRSVAWIYERYCAGRGADCLDLGCGDGRALGMYLQPRARSYVGVDVSETAVALARGAGLRAERIDDASRLPFGDESFDFVACVEVLEHLFATEETARELRRVLRPGGIAVVQVPNIAHWRSRLELGLRGRFVALGDSETLSRPWRDPHIRFFTFDSMSRLLEHEGLRVLERHALGGNQARDLPGLGRFVSTPAAGPVSRQLMRLRPSLFGNRIQVVAAR